MNFENSLGILDLHEPMMTFDEHPRFNRSQDFIELSLYVSATISTLLKFFGIIFRNCHVKSSYVAGIDFIILIVAIMSKTYAVDLLMNGFSTVGSDSSDAPFKMISINLLFGVSLYAPSGNAKLSGIGDKGYDKAESKSIG